MPNKYKVVVYAISKNESKFVDRWYESMKEADEIYVLDTGSTDDTVERLKSHGIKVNEEVIIPWRFDVARNKSLDFVPLDTDICVCTDLDEVLSPGWRQELEKSWGNSNRLRYLYNWALDDFGNPKVSFLYEKIHDRIHYKWIYPVHEVLECSIDNEDVAVNTNIILNHYPDRTKSRSSYLPLLELSNQEYPDNDRNLHYLGREYMYYHEWNKCIDTLLKHINLPTSTWNAEKSASMRFIARSYLALKRPEEAKYWYKRAIDTSPNTREAYVELALLNYQNGEHFETITNCLKAKTILKNDLVYINEPFCWDHTIDDLLSISYYNLGIKDLAIYHINKALEYGVDTERLQKNKEIFTQ